MLEAGYKLWYLDLPLVGRCLNIFLQSCQQQLRVICYHDYGEAMSLFCSQGKFQWNINTRSIFRILHSVHNLHLDVKFFPFLNQKRAKTFKNKCEQEKKRKFMKTNFDLWMWCAALIFWSKYTTISLYIIPIDIYRILFWITTTLNIKNINKTGSQPVSRHYLRGCKVPLMLK